MDNKEKLEQTLSGRIVNPSATTTSVTDGNINHYTSDTYPLEEWHEAEHLSTDLSKPQIIVEDHYSE